MNNQTPYIDSSLPKTGDSVVCSFCNKTLTVLSVTPDKFGGYIHLKKHTCIDLSKDSYYSQIKTVK